MLDQRKTERNRSFLGATILYNRGLWSTPCVVKNMSGGGARVVTHNAPALPDRFELHIAQKKMTRQVLTKWREGDVIGLAFQDDDCLAASNDNVNTFDLVHGRQRR